MNEFWCINHIPDVMSEFDCRVLSMMKMKRIIESIHESYNED